MVPTLFAFFILFSPDWRTVWLAREAPGFSRPDGSTSEWTADFDGDGRADAAWLVHHLAAREWRLYAFLGNTKAGVKLASWNAVGPSARPPRITLKAPGSPGLSARTFNSITGDGDPPPGAPPEALQARQEQRAAPYVRAAALEFCTGLEGDVTDAGEKDRLWCHCSQGAWLRGGVWQATRACD